MLHTKGDIQISHEVSWKPGREPSILNNRIVVKTGNDDDVIHVSKGPGKQIQITVNGNVFKIDTETKKGPQLGLWIDAKGGNDKITIDQDVMLRVDVDGGDGDDDIQAGGGRSRLCGGAGNDTLRLGSGLGYAEGNDGDDTLIGGSGNGVMYGNNGNDRLYAGTGGKHKQSYLDGGNGNDQLYAGKGHSVLHGGNGDDDLVGHDRTTFYTGKGQDRIRKNQAHDRIYAKINDQFNRNVGSSFTPVSTSNAGERGFTVAGDEDFKQRVADDFEFMRSSPNGQKVLAEMDALADTHDSKVTIKPIGFGSCEYVFGSKALDALRAGGEGKIDESSFGRITNGVAGSRADRARIHYDALSIIEEKNGNTIVPVTGLYHEIIHAWNGAKGTFLSGSSKADDPSTKADSSSKDSTHNEEFQAIGIPNTATPFDLDDDPSTPPTTVNPKHFTENALNEEMGKPLRKFHLLTPSRQGYGL
ncbi:hemolysin-like protein [Pseudomonas sp. KBW05]|nr:hemolysin-like protein [Pseudomonas sp. KBW05]